MEPRRDDGDDAACRGTTPLPRILPQWSPVVTTGTTVTRDVPDSQASTSPQWSPVVTTGTTFDGSDVDDWTAMPQWSPVVTTGTTARAFTRRCCA